MHAENPEPRLRKRNDFSDASPLEESETIQTTCGSAFERAQHAEVSWSRHAEGLKPLKLPRWRRMCAAV